MYKQISLIHVYSSEDNQFEFYVSQLKFKFYITF